MPEKNATPLYAAAGAADAAVAALRELSARAPDFAQRAETLTTQVRDRLTGLPADVQKLRAADMQKLRSDLLADLQKRRSELPSDVQRLRSELPTDFQKLRADLPTLMQDVSAKILQFAAGLVSGLSERYEEFADRGEIAVARFRRESADAVDTVKDKAADAASTVTDKAADAADKAADAADKVADEIADAPVAQRKRRPSTR
jgi:hypothetical protein